MEHADDVTCLHKQDARRYANTYIDRQVGKPIVPRDMFEQTCYGSAPSTDDINTFRPLNLVIAIGTWRDFKPT